MELPYLTSGLSHPKVRTSFLLSVCVYVYTAFLSTSNRVVGGSRLTDAKQFTLVLLFLFVLSSTQITVNTLLPIPFIVMQRSPIWGQYANLLRACYSYEGQTPPTSQAGSVGFIGSPGDSDVRQVESVTGVVVKSRNSSQTAWTQILAPPV